MPSGTTGPGDRALAALRDAGVEVSGVVRRAGTPTGVAVLVVDAEGENTIVVDPGRQRLARRRGDGGRRRRPRPAVLLLQLEVPLPAVVAAARAATGTVVLNPAPMPDDPGPVRALLPSVDVLVPNRSELGRLAGRSEPRTAAEVADGVAALGHAGGVVVTLGAEGALCFPGPGAAPVVVAGERRGGRWTRAARATCSAAPGPRAREGASLPDAARRANALAAASTAYPGARIDPRTGPASRPGWSARAASRPAGDRRRRAGGAPPP